MSPRPRLVPCTLAATIGAALLLGGCSSSSGAASAPASTSSIQAPVTTAPRGSKVNAPPDQCIAVAQTYGAVSSAILPVLQGKTGPAPFDADELGHAVSVDTMGTIPAELAPDFAAFTAAAGKLRGKDLTAAAEVMGGPEITAASHHIEAFLSDHC